MRLVFKILICVTASIILGLGLTWATLLRGDFGMVSNGPWQTSLLQVDPESGDYLRASHALKRLFSLNRGDTMTYIAAYDSAGQKLDGNCNYRIQGHEPNARWWSLTVYDSEGYLMPNTRKSWTITGNDVQLKHDSSFVIHAAPRRAPENWLPVSRGQHFVLALRLYHPGPGVVLDPETALVPSIQRMVCV